MFLGVCGGFFWHYQERKPQSLIHVHSFERQGESKLKLVVRGSVNICVKASSELRFDTLACDV